MKLLAKITAVLTLAAALTLTACGGGGGGGTAPGDSVVTISEISGVTPPNYGETPVTTITETAQFTGTVEWSGSPETFAATTVYTATITLTAKPGYTLEGLAEDFFTVAGATTVSNSADSGVITAVFPVTGPAPGAGDKETYTADGVSFKMAYVPGGLTFPTGIGDNSTATVADAYWIAETEVTYELWNKVYTWATDTARGANQYYFANPGREGNDGTIGAAATNQEPVTTVNWRDSMVWCNALTEWYNAQKSTSYECVYTYSSAIIRDSRDTNATACDGVVASSTAKGFRLLSRNEYELAARYRNGTLWTYGDHASGDESGACYNDGSILGGMGLSTVFGNYAWYSDNSGSSTPVVGTAGNSGGAACTGNANALGLYDMSGNVWEWCFDLSGSGRVRRGGGWHISAGRMQVGYWLFSLPNHEHGSLGFRFARTQ